jgi:hypothetical protein
MVISCHSGWLWGPSLGTRGSGTLLEVVSYIAAAAMAASCNAAETTAFGISSE